MATLENRTDFYKRYVTSKRTMKIEEIRDSILSSPRFRQGVSQEQTKQAIPAIPVAVSTMPQRVAQPAVPSLQPPTARETAFAESEFGDYPPAVQLFTERPVEKFLYRYLLGGTIPQALVIVSPYISSLSGSAYKLESVVKKVNADRTRLYVITQPPREEYQRAGLRLLEKCPYAEIRYNPNIHAKLYISWSPSENESFGLFGSGNLTEGGLKNNIELGLMIFARGHGRPLLRELYYWSTNTVRSTSQRVKAIGL
jgi:hypothetical protein